MEPRRNVAAVDRRWFEEPLPARLESSDEYDQVAGAWARARRPASPYHGAAFAARAAHLAALLRDFEAEVARRADPAGSGDTSLT